MRLTHGGLESLYIPKCEVARRRRAGSLRMWKYTKWRAISIGWPCVALASVPTISEEPMQGAFPSSNRSHQMNHERRDFHLKRLRLSSTKCTVAQSIKISPHVFLRTPRTLSVGPPPFPLFRIFLVQYMGAITCSGEGTNINLWKSSHFR